MRRGRREGPACTWAGLHEDKLEEIQRTCGRALQDQGTRSEYEADRQKGQSPETEQGSERNEAQVICSGILLLCREGQQILVTLESLRSGQKPASVRNFGIHSQREDLSCRVTHMQLGK